MTADLERLGLFMAATLTLNLTPGPDMLYVAARSAGQGLSAGIVSALGIAVGCLVHMLAVALGIASLMLTVPIAYEVVRFAGAGYLVYLGGRILLSRRATGAPTELETASLRTIFLQGVVTNVLNPKVALFFLAFLPQFADPARASVGLQLLLLGVLFNASGTLVNVGVALLASLTRDRLQRRLTGSAVFQRLTGGVFVGLGLRLALLERR